MTRTKPITFLASAVMKRGGGTARPPTCLACGARIDSSEPTIKIRGALVHMHCAVQRRRMVRR